MSGWWRAGPIFIHAYIRITYVTYVHAGEEPERCEWLVARRPYIHTCIYNVHAGEETERCEWLVARRPGQPHSSAWQSLCSCSKGVVVEQVGLVLTHAYVPREWSSSGWALYSHMHMFQGSGRRAGGSYSVAQLPPSVSTTLATAMLQFMCCHAIWTVSFARAALATVCIQLAAPTWRGTSVPRLFQGAHTAKRQQVHGLGFDEAVWRLFAESASVFGPMRVVNSRPAADIAHWHGCI